MTRPRIKKRRRGTERGIRAGMAMVKSGRTPIKILYVLTYTSVEAHIADHLLVTAPTRFRSRRSTSVGTQLPSSSLAVDSRFGPITPHVPIAIDRPDCWVPLRPAPNSLPSILHFAYHPIRSRPWKWGRSDDTTSVHHRFETAFILYWQVQFFTE